MIKSTFAIRWQRIRNAAKGKSLRAQLVRGGVGTVGVKVSSIAMLFTLTLILARILGPESYGLYSYVFALVALMAIPAQFGLPALVVRETAKAQTTGDWATLKGLWRWAAVVASMFSFLLVVVGILVAWLLSEYYTSKELTTFVWALAMMPLYVLGRVIGGALRGLHYVISGQFTNDVLRPGLLVIFVLSVIALGAGGRLDADSVMGLHFLSALLATLFGGMLLFRAQPAEVSGRVAEYHNRAWLVSAMPLGLIAGMYLINRQIDILILGMFTDAGQVGVYRVATQGATLVTFGLEAVSIAFAAQFVKMYVNGQYEQLQRLATIGARIALIFALPVTMVFASYGGSLLHTLVGPEYASGATPLIILALGQMITAGLGPVAMLLNMTGHEHIIVRSGTQCVLFNLMANLVLIPHWGMNGAALATSLTFVIWSSILVVQLYKRMRINSTSIRLTRMHF